MKTPYAAVALAATLLSSAAVAAPLYETCGSRLLTRAWNGDLVCIGAQYGGGTATRQFTAAPTPPAPPTPPTPPSPPGDNCGGPKGEGGGHEHEGHHGHHGGEGHEGHHGHEGDGPSVQ